MYKVFALAVAGLMATLPFASAGVATKSCACYTKTVTVEPEVCLMCAPTLDCLVYPTITTTIPGPNPTCTETATVTETSDCPCGATTCPTAWETVTGKFTCKRGGTKETNIAGTGAAETSDVTTTSTSLVPSETGMMSILPIETLDPVDVASAV